MELVEKQCNRGDGGRWCVAKVIVKRRLALQWGRLVIGVCVAWIGIVRPEGPSCPGGWRHALALRSWPDGLRPGVPAITKLLNVSQSLLPGCRAD